MTDTELLLEAAYAMRRAHGPDHPRHEMWATMASLLAYHSGACLGAPDSQRPGLHNRMMDVAKAYLEAES